MLPDDAIFEKSLVDYNYIFKMNPEAQNDSKIHLMTYSRHDYLIFGEIYNKHMLINP